MNSIKKHIKNITGLTFRAYCNAFNALNDKTFIFMYHRVQDDSDNNLYDSAMFVKKSSLEMHINELSKCFNIISIEDIDNEDKITSKPQCILTFDDGWSDNYYYALPVLSSTGFPATIFITMNYIGTKNNFWFHNIWLLAQNCLLNRTDLEFFNYFSRHVEYDGDHNIDESNVAAIISALKACSPEEIEIIVNNAIIEFGLEVNSTQTMLTWDQVNELIDNGITIGSHGMNHHILTRINPEQRKYEITESLSILKNKVYGLSKYFCYPNGNYDVATINLVKEAGYIGAIGTEIGYNTHKTNNFCLNRIAIHDEISSSPGLLWFRILQAYIKTGH